jgi:hypothetical protein
LPQLRVTEFDIAFGLGQQPIAQVGIDLARAVLQFFIRHFMETGSLLRAAQFSYKAFGELIGMMLNKAYKMTSQHDSSNLVGCG